MEAVRPIFSTEREGQNGILTEDGRVDLLLDIYPHRSSFRCTIRATLGAQTAQLELTDGTIKGIYLWLDGVASRLGVGINCRRWGPIQTVIARDWLPRVLELQKRPPRPLPVANAPKATSVVNAGQQFAPRE